MSEQEMSRKTYQMLERLFDAGDKDIENRILNNDVESKDRINQLQELGYVGTIFPRSSGSNPMEKVLHYKITTKGRDYINELKRREEEAFILKKQQELQHSADQAQRVRDRKQQFRHDWMIAIFSAIGGAIFGAGATLFIEHVLLR